VKSKARVVGNEKRSLPGEAGPMAEHAITVIEVGPADPDGRRDVAARCACGWRGTQRTGRQGADEAAADGARHLRQVEDSR
jgi:hypothetical protein